MDRPLSLDRRYGDDGSARGVGGRFPSHGNGVSADGAVVVGWRARMGAGPRGFSLDRLGRNRLGWGARVEVVLRVPGQRLVSADGSVVVGRDDGGAAFKPFYGEPPG